MTRALALGKLRQYKNQNEDLKVALDLKPNDSYALHAQGYAYLDQWQNQTAIKNANHALRLNPKDGEAFFQRGRAYLNLEQYKNCINDCTIANSYSPGEYSIFYIRGCAYLAMKDRRAIEDFKQIVLIRPDRCQSYKLLADCYSDFQMHKQCVEALTKAISFNSPKNSFLYYMRCNSHLKLEEYKAAIDDADSFLVLDRSSDVLTAWAYARKGEAQFKLEKLDQCIENCTSALNFYKASKFYELRATAREHKGQDVLAVIDRVQALITDLPSFERITYQFKDFFRSAEQSNSTN
jgi:tetratricopeptide (TPR) repeat protein